MNTCTATRNGVPCSLEHGHDRPHFAAESGESWPHEAWPTGRAWVTLADMRATVYPVRAVPLRASAVAAVVGPHVRAAREMRDAAAVRLEAAERPIGDTDEERAWWRSSGLASARTFAAKADAHEQAAGRWLARVSA